MKELKPSVPFFARFLESQEFPRVKTDVKGGPGKGGGGGGIGGGSGPGTVVTMKYPSDDDDDPPVVEF